MTIKAEGGRDQPLISVNELVKLAEGGSTGGSSSGSASSSSGSSSAAPADSVKIHTR